MKKLITLVLASALLTGTTGALTASAQTPVNICTTVTDFNAAVSKIKLSASEKTVYIGQKYTLFVKSVSPASASKAVTWESSDSSVASVSSKGVITGKSKGTAVITAVSKYNKKVKATCVVTVKDYGKKNISYDYASVVFDVPSKDYSNLDDSVVVITGTKERNALIRKIKSGYPEYAKAVAQLKKYDDNFFADHSLIYSRTTTYGVSSEFVKADITACLKKFSGGKLTVYVKSAYSENVPSDFITDNEYHARFNCYFTAVDKKSIKNAADFKLLEKKVAGKNFPRTVVNCKVKAVLEPTNYNFNCSDKSVIVKSSEELSELISMIEDSYPDNSNILAELSAYDEEFFDSNSLLYCRKLEHGYSALEYYEYTFKPTVLKMTGGIVKAYLKPQISFNLPEDMSVSDEYVGRTVCYIAELDKQTASKTDGIAVVY